MSYLIFPRMVPPDNPAQWTWDEARAVLALGRDVGENLDFYDGDHWQRGNGWVGPKLDPSTGEVGDEVMGLLKSAFTSANVIKEVTHRHRDAVLGHPIMWHGGPRRFLPEGTPPAESEKSVIQVIEAALTRWGDTAKVQEAFLKAAVQMLLAQRGVLRLFVPLSALDIITIGDPESGTAQQVQGVVAGTLDEALDKIAIEAPSVKVALLYEHPRTRQRIGVVRQVVDNAEVISLYYLVRDRLTEIRQLAPDRDMGPAIQLALGGRLPLVQAELVDGPLITEQVRQNQRAMNLALSMVPRSAVTSGFLERVFLDTMPPGEWEYNEIGERTSFTPGKHRLGAGTTTFAQGTSYRDPSGQLVVKDAGVEYRDPIDPKAPFNAAMYHYSVMLAEVRQEHVLTNTEALMSGKSREQARAGFEASVRPTKQQCELLAMSVYETALAMAEAFIGQPGQYTTDFRIVATCRVDTGPSAASEREQDNEAADKNLMAPQTVMERAGIVDVDAEMARIAASPEYKIRILQKQFEALEMATTAGVPVDIAAEQLGMDAKFVSAVKQAREEKERQERADAEAARRAQTLRSQQSGRNNRPTAGPRAVPA